MTNVDVAALAAELAPLLVGARLEKAYQPAKEQILLRLRRKGAGRIDLLFELGKFVTVTQRPPENPDKPSMVAQILRTNLENSRVTGLAQVGFDRLLRLDLERGDGRRSLVLELFGDGNLLLLDGEGVILLPMKGGDFGARSLRKGQPYLPPPGSSRPFELTQEGLAARLAAAKRDLVRCLALDLGFGPLWAEELALRAGVDKATPAAQLGPAQVAAVHAALRRLGDDIARNDLAPALVYAQEAGAAAVVDAVPFPLLRFPAPGYSHEEAASFRAALDQYFIGTVDAGEGEEEPEDPRQARLDEAVAKVQRQVDQVAAAIDGFVAEEGRHKADGEALYAGFAQVQGILDALHKARADRSWAEVERTLAAARRDGNPFARQVAELRPHNGTALLRLTLLDGSPRDVEVDLRLTVQENAEACYAAAKKARSRREGADKALQDARGRLREVEEKGLDAFGAPPAKVERVSRHFWFESYRWTITPSGLVAVGGRNASQNDQVVKKYLRDGDRYVHAEIHGAPSVVVRPAEGTVPEIPPEDLRAACHFAVTSSRAWRQSGSATAYWVTASQVSKTPRSGEFVPRGAWIIHGKRNVEPDLPMRWWVGRIHLDPQGRPIARDQVAQAPRSFAKLVGGTQESLQRYATDLLEMVPGRMDPADAAQSLVERYGVQNEEAQAVLPAGPVQFVGA
ncbi:MAG TPA: ribosome rescue protein RqcH [Candidatus Thermoplasmatota archaeon]|nr:ribosome rescue protein RqcH [Candidatus Thermoplasmatota archaeon]